MLCPIIIVTVTNEEASILSPFFMSYAMHLFPLYGLFRNIAKPRPVVRHEAS
jgi:hypothetical protein